MIEVKDPIGQSPELDLTLRDRDERRLFPGNREIQTGDCPIGFFPRSMKYCRPFLKGAFVFTQMLTLGMLYYRLRDAP